MTLDEKLPMDGSDEKSPFGSKGKEKEISGSRSSPAFGSTGGSSHSPFSDEAPTPISLPMAHNSEYRREDHNQKSFYNIPPPLSLGSFGSSSSSSSGPFSQENNEPLQSGSHHTPASSSSSSSSSPLDPKREQDAGEAMLDGAQQLMKRKPRWIKSSIAKDGLPKPRSSTDSDGYDIDNPKYIEKLGAKNDFAKWLRGESELPEEGARMNCWEAVFTSAYYGRLVTRDQLVALYGKTVNEKDPTEALLNQLGRNATRPIDKNSPPPAPGDIILIDNDRIVGFHVFIAGKAGKAGKKRPKRASKHDQAYSHDKSDSLRGVTYKDYSFTGDHFNLMARGSTDSMVHRSRLVLTDYASEAIFAQTKKFAEIRYLSPKIFRELSK